MTIDHDQLKADVGAGTRGPYETYGDGSPYQVISPAGDAELGNWLVAECWWEVDARRIAHLLNADDRMPDLEAAYLAATARADRAEAELATLRASLPDVMRAERERCAVYVDRLCPKCAGNNWLWSHELDDRPERDESYGQDDTKYSCDGKRHRDAAAIRALWMTHHD